MKDFIQRLPEECRGLTIEPRHKIALQHYQVGDDVWIVLLTLMPGDSPKAWKMSRRDYWSLQPKHGTRDRYIRENIAPTIEGARNPPKRTQTLLLL